MLAYYKHFYILNLLFYIQGKFKHAISYMT